MAHDVPGEVARERAPQRQVGRKVLVAREAARGSQRQHQQQQRQHARPPQPREGPAQHHAGADGGEVQAALGHLLLLLLLLLLLFFFFFLKGRSRWKTGTGSDRPPGLKNQVEKKRKEKGMHDGRPDGTNRPMGGERAGQGGEDIATGVESAHLEADDEGGERWRGTRVCSKCAGVVKRTSKPTMKKAGEGGEEHEFVQSVQEW